MSLQMIYNRDETVDRRRKDMNRKFIIKRRIALFLAALLIFVAPGCGRENTDGNRGAVPEDVKSSAAQQEDTDAGGMGRYMDETVFQSEADLIDQVQSQVTENGELIFLNCPSGQKFISEDNGNTWENAIERELVTFTEKNYVIAAAIAKDGTLAMVSMESGDDEGEKKYPLYIYDKNGELKEIPLELPGEDMHLNDLTFGEDGCLLASVMGDTSVYEIDLQNGSSKKLVDIPDRADVMYCKDGILLCGTFSGIYLYDLKNSGFIEDKVLDSFIKENKLSVEWTGGGYTNFTFLGEDHAVYIAGETGLYRHVIGGSTIEQIIDGSLSSLGDPSHNIMSVLPSSDTEFFVMFNDGSINRFSYEANVSTVPRDKLTVYSLEENETVKQAISSYQAITPGIHVDYRIGMNDESVTREDALKKLNTELLSGSGPDILILDGINIDVYAEKGVLTDLSDVVKEADSKGGLYTNLIAPFYQGEQLYALPVQFGIPVLAGHETAVRNITDYTTFADMTERARKEYPEGDLLGVYSESGLIKRLYSVCAPSWKDNNGNLDKNRIKEFLVQTKRIYDAQMNGTPQKYIDAYRENAEEYAPYENSAYFRMLSLGNYYMGDSPFGHGEVINEYGYMELLSSVKIKGFEDTVYGLMNGQAQNIYHPATIVGVNAASENGEQAKDFIRTMMGSSVQDVLQTGLPINRESLKELFAYDEADLGEDGALSYISSTSEDGREIEYAIYPASQEDIERLESWIEKLETPYLQDAVLEDAVLAGGISYLKGDQDVDAAVQEIENKVAIYLAE